MYVLLWWGFRICDPSTTNSDTNHFFSEFGLEEERDMCDPFRIIGSWDLLLTQNTKGSFLSLSLSLSLSSLISKYKVKAPGLNM